MSDCSLLDTGLGGSANGQLGVSQRGGRQLICDRVCELTVQAPLVDTAVLETLRSVAEEAVQLAGPRRRAVVEGLRPHSPALFAFLAARPGELLSSFSSAIVSAH